LSKPACRRVPVIGPLAVGIGVVDIEAEARTLARGGPLHHLLITVRITERSEGTPADVLMRNEPPLPGAT
jgi:hypothetical protein